MATTEFALPSGVEFIETVGLTQSQGKGVEALIIISVISLIAVVFLLSVILGQILVSIVKKTTGLFVRTHAAAYVISLLITDLFQAIGSIMSAKWVMKMGVDNGQFCDVQGMFKQAADVGTAIWALIIAIHTFNILFLRISVPRYVMLVTLFGGWSFIGFIVTLGPSIIAKPERGPFFGISGYWCWIADGYPVERIVMDYMIMFISAFFSTMLYSLIFLRLRGNILVSGSRMRFRFVSRSNAWKLHVGRDHIDVQMANVAKSMLLYPIAYTILLLPIAIVRFVEWTGGTPSFGAVIFSDSVFLLIGLVNAILFMTTRRVLPSRFIVPSFSRSRMSQSDTSSEYGITPLTLPPTAEIKSATEKGYVDSPDFSRMGQTAMLERAPSPAYSHHSESSGSIVSLYADNDVRVPERPYRPADHRPLTEILEEDDRMTHRTDSVYSMQTEVPERRKF